jgi:chemotaxis protein CheX
MPELMMHTQNDKLDPGVLLQLDTAVGEVFDLMVGMQAIAIQPTVLRIKPLVPGVKTKGDELVTAIVAFAGTMSGSCLIQMQESAALKVTSAMLGARVTMIDSHVTDAIGELCNMVAGCWKNKMPAITSECLLSVPTVVTGDSYAVHHSMNIYTRRAYEFEDMQMVVTLLCGEIQ